MGIPLMYLGFESGEVMVVVDLPLLEPSMSVERDGCRTARDLALAELALPEINGGVAPVIGCAGETAMTATLFTSEQQGETEHAFRVSLCQAPGSTADAYRCAAKSTEAVVKSHVTGRGHPISILH